MKISDALKGVVRLYIETAPIIYFVERNPTYLERIRAIFKLIDENAVTGVTSVITLTEVLTQPVKANNAKVEKAYRDILLNSPHFTVLPIDEQTAVQAAILRAKYNLRTPDALQIAVGITSGCQAFLTNDRGLIRVSEISMVIVDDLNI